MALYHNVLRACAVTQRSSIGSVPASRAVSRLPHFYGPEDADHHFFGSAPVVANHYMTMLSKHSRFLLEDAGVALLTPIERLARRGSLVPFFGPRTATSTRSHQTNRAPSQQPARGSRSTRTTTAARWGESRANSKPEGRRGRAEVCRPATLT